MIHGEPDPNRYYWPKFIVASVIIASATAVANECAKVLSEALRKRWNLPPHDERKEQ